ncbi:hypothetical protein POREN0001_0735 [Porphyromonas endodontalis ATCC 35406]|uniref:Uncharacterized protein n=1 Tax=Porphyromonas endodontalis (strain ATCC 35406 / DSM 24491 / JCM 8526 / CCUG 16442 / BCRC 14492 / NCTC 13058 / HG 370) TaxID=553175 RepID=C3J9I4_POREA|nr:hypothetical protein POREN0001_0735 [Porphyromonas endodontalis ATCC 35406]
MRFHKNILPKNHKQLELGKKPPKWGAPLGKKGYFCRSK